MVSHKSATMYLPGLGSHLKDQLGKYPLQAFFHIVVGRIYLFIYLLKVTFHLQLSQNIGYIPRVAQYIPEPILYPVVSAPHTTTPILPLPTITGNQ